MEIGINTSDIKNENKNSDIISSVQWAFTGQDSFTPCNRTKELLDPGYYTIDLGINGQMIFKKMKIKTDRLIEFPDSLSAKILNEMDQFWELYDTFKRYGQLHKRGYLLYGPHGSGKTCLTHIIFDKIIKKGGLILDCRIPKTLHKALEKFREVEPDRSIICVFEDIDGIIKSYGSEELLNILDGRYMIDRVLFVATTNYPELLEKRLIRPKRFDRLYLIDMPSKSQRKIYLTNILNNSDIVDEWVDKTDDFSFANLSELIISTMCLGNDFDETIEILRKADKNISSSDFNAKLGF